MTTKCKKYQPFPTKIISLINLLAHVKGLSINNYIQQFDKLFVNNKVQEDGHFTIGRFRTGLKCEI